MYTYYISLHRASVFSVLFNTHAEFFVAPSQHDVCEQPDLTKHFWEPIIIDLADYGFSVAARGVVSNISLYVDVF